MLMDCRVATLFPMWLLAMTGNWTLAAQVRHRERSVAIHRHSHSIDVGTDTWIAAPLRGSQ